MSESRAEFEAWFSAEMCQSADFSLDDEYYDDLYVQTAWRGWQASRAQPERKMTDAEIHKIWQDSYLVALKNAGFCIGNSDVAHMNQHVVFARNLLAAQPAAATAPDKSMGNQREIGAKMPSGAVVTNVFEAFNEGLKAAAMAQAAGVNMHTQSTHPENVSKQSPEIDMSCSENRRRAGLVYSRTCPICKLGPCQSKAKQ